MAKQKLTQGWINKLKPDGDSDAIYWDEGPGRFGIRVKNGRISYMVQYRPAMKAKGVAAKSRRYASLAGEMGVGELVIAHILGQSAGRGTTRGYA